MATDKPISGLPAATAIQLTDLGVLVDNGITEKFTFQLLVMLLQANIAAGSVFTFGTIIPSNTSGANSDVFLKTDTGVLYQRITGTWTLKYTFPTGSTFKQTFATGQPLNTTGNNGDVNIDPTTGIFYQKNAGTWAQVFSMQTGPQGPQGTPGTNGTNGTNGNTILYGNGNPSNSLGVNGNFYINTANYTFYGPKDAGVWPAGVSLGIVSPVFLDFTATTALPIMLTSFQTNYSAFGRRPSFETWKKINNGDGTFSYQDLTSSQTVIVKEVTAGIPDSVSIEVNDDGTGHLASDIQVVIKT